MPATAPTTTRSAIQLSIGDRITAPDGAVHTVTGVEHYDVGLGITDIDTDTGIHLTKHGYERMERIYDVQV
jgi:hypothetical protein